MKYLNAAALAVLATAGLAAQAGEVAEAVAAPAAKPVVEAPPAAKPALFGAGAAVSLQRLTGSRGGASTQVDIGGAVKDATATNVSTGNNAIRDGSFSNAVGFNTVIQNSGANVLIQNSMTVNVQFK